MVRITCGANTSAADTSGANTRPFTADCSIMSLRACFPVLSGTVDVQPVACALAAVELTVKLRDLWRLALALNRVVLAGPPTRSVCVVWLRTPRFRGNDLDSEPAQGDGVIADDASDYSDSRQRPGSGPYCHPPRTLTDSLKSLGPAGLAQLRWPSSAAVSTGREGIEGGRASCSLESTKARA